MQNLPGHDLERRGLFPRGHLENLRFKFRERLPELWKYHSGVWRYRLRRFKLEPLWYPIDRWFSQLGRFEQYSQRPLRRENFPAHRRKESELPTIAIVTPSYEQADFLAATIRSVLESGYPHLQYAVIDGGSTDGSAEILQQFAQQLTYSTSEPDEGQVFAISEGFKQVAGEVMAYLNSDDLLLPGALRYVGEYFADHPEVDVVYGHRIVVNQEGLEIGRWVLPVHEPEGIRRVDFIPQETLFWRKKLFNQVGGLDHSFSFAMDWDLILKFQNAGAKIVRLPYFLGCFRVHPKQKTKTLLGTVGDREIERIRLRELGADPEDWELWRYEKRLKRAGVFTRFLKMPFRRFWK